MRSKTIKQKSVQAHIRKAVKEYNSAVPNATAMRQEQIQTWAEAAAKRGDKTAAQHFKSMAHAEESIETFRILQRIIKPQDCSGITRLDVPTHDAEGIERVNLSLIHI